VTTPPPSNARPEWAESLAVAPGSDGDDTGWLITFSDLVLQLFAFVLVVAVCGGAARHAVRATVRERKASATVAAVDGPVLGNRAAPDLHRARPDALTAFEPAARPEPGGGLEATAWAGDGAADPSAVTKHDAEDAPAAVDALAAADVVVPDERVEDRPPASERVRKLAGYLGAFVAARGDGDDAAVIVGDTDVRLDFGGRLGFPPGGAELLAAGRSLVHELQRIASGVPNLTIEVSGYTDDVPIHTREFPSNLELSLARAARVVREIERDDPSLAVRTVALGFAEHHAIVPNDGPDNRARNRRVEVRLVDREEAGG
jgi:chemotaxis protein MotB